MANTKISELSAVTALAGTDVFPVVDVSASTTNKVSVEDLLRNAPDGSAGAPSIANAGDQDTGILFPADNSVGVSTGGTQRLVIDSSGNCGIGTSSPSTRFHLTGNDSNEFITLAHATRTGSWIIRHSGTNSENLEFQQNNGSTTVRSYLAGRDIHEFHTNGSECLRIDSSGQVGIGTDNPFGKLHIQDTSSDLELFLVGPSAGSARIRFGDTTDTNIGQIIYDNTNDSLQIHANNAERMRITSSGNVGIGTSSPDEKLDVDGTIKTETINYASNQDQPYLIAGTTSYTGATTDWGTYGFQHRFKSNSGGTSRVTIDTLNGEAFCVDNGNRVGIGTSDPDVKLDVNGDANDSILPNNALFKFKTTGGNGLYMGTRASSPYQSYIQSAFHNNNNNNNPYALLLNPEGGNVGIGTSSPDAKFEVVTDSTGKAEVARFRIEGQTNNPMLRLFSDEANNVLSLETSASVSGHQLAFATNGTERMRIDSSGNVGIGTSSPSSSLHILSTIPTLTFEEGNGVTTISGDTADLTYTVPSGRTHNFLGGNVGIGTDTPSQTLDVNGNARFRGAIYDGNNGAGTAGQVLSSTGTGVDWVDPTGSASFDGLTNKGSGTGDYSTTGDLESGRGSGGVALTINDGYGNANVTFNHSGGTPEQNGKAGRIEVNTDATTGNATMSFELGSATSGVAAGITQVLELSDGTSTFSGTTTFNGTVNIRSALDLADNDILRFGSGDDCEMFVNGTHMYMDLNSGIGNFYIRDGTTIRYTFNDNGNFTATGNITATGNLNGTLGNSQVRDAIALGNDGNLGTYAMLKKTSGDNTSGSNVSGSNLRFSNAAGNTSGTPSGTWKCMGRSLDDATADQLVTVWLRVA